MDLDVRVEKRLVKIARDLGLPTEPLFHAYRFRRIAMAPKEWMKRKASLRQMRENSQFTDFIDVDKGYRLFGPNDIPGIGEAVAAAADFYERKRAQIDVSSAKKPYFYNIATRSDLEELPAILEFAKSAPMMEAAGGYLGMKPTLEALGVYLSMANDHFEKSQKFHIDFDDLRQVKCFINVSNVEALNGPFTFIPADRSRAIRLKLRHQWRNPRISDDELENVIRTQDEETVQILGAPGYGALVDTSSCLHYGSRCKSGYRLVIMIRYGRFPNVQLLKKEALQLRADGTNGAPCSWGSSD